VSLDSTVNMGTREASHAGSWYEDDPVGLSQQLDEFLGRVPDTLDQISLPIPSARVIIAPYVLSILLRLKEYSLTTVFFRHAGYTYSGPCAAWAYKVLDLSTAKRVFVLGPSHTYYLRGCALTSFDKYETPFGDLSVDRATTNQLEQTGHFTLMPTNKDVAEHSLEMHLPYLWKRLQQTFGEDSSKYPPIVPILVGDGTTEQERFFGQLLSPYLKDPENAFIVSSDFCHWGSRFSYRPVYSDGGVRNIDARSSASSLPVDTNMLSNTTAGPDGPPIHEVIRVLDEMAMDAVISGVHSNFYTTVQETENTVCGRHPIGVVLACLESIGEDGQEDGKGKFKFVQYQRSNLVKRTNDFSVSYASAYAVV